jgi:hypothetical protein
MKPGWDNQERHRYYGLRVGDTVRAPTSLLRVIEEDRIGEVVEYGFMDNNRVYVQYPGDKNPVAEVAEWLTIIKKVEDK